MPTILFQDLQSCIEAQTLETRTLRLKLSSPDPESRGWNILSLYNSPQIPRDIQSSYVHPMSQHSYPKLSSRSLQLCTEHLGCETGSDMIESSTLSFPSMDLELGERKRTEEPEKTIRCLSTGKTPAKDPQDFPPPLTTISGSNPLQVRKHRVGGRLVIEAVEVPYTHGHLQAERSNGRLRLNLFRDSDIDGDDYYPENESPEDEIEELENENEEEDSEEIKGEEGFDGDDEEEGDVYGSGDMGGISLEIGSSLGIEKFQRPTRCKDGGRCNKGLCNWEPFWVATS